MLSENINATPKNAHRSAKYKKSLAYLTLKDDLPVILTRIVDHLVRCKEDIIRQYGERAREEIKFVIGRFSELKNELQTNKPFMQLTCEADDADLWNLFLSEQRSKEGELQWFSTTCLYAECYMYRRARHIFQLTDSLQNFDPFSAGKQTSFMSSLEACVKIGDHQLKLLNTANIPHDKLKHQFIELLKMSLYSNKFDMALTLGISKGVTNEETLDYAGRFLENLADGTEDIWESLSQAQDIPIIDIVLDNAGFELFVDLCLADFLHTLMGARKVRLHAKAMPWFVSNATSRDVEWTIETLSQVEAYSPSLPRLAERWRGFLDSGAWTLQAHRFWTLPHEFSEMGRVAGDLHRALADSFLVVFKGDVNYRKLMGEKNWPFTVSFHTALQGFHPTRIAALRVVKSDILCGLTAELEETVLAKGPRWYTHGQYAVIQYD